MQLSRPTLESLESRRLLAAADPVLTFGFHGLVQANDADTGWGAITTLSNHSTLLARVTGSANSTTPGVTRLTRYLADGSPDPSFGGAGQPAGTPAGTVQIGGNTFFADIAAMTTDANGKILIAGTFWTGTDITDLDFGIVRLNTDGSLDPNFGGPFNGYASAPTGLVQIDVSAHSTDHLNDFALANDGRIALVGDTQPAEGSGATSSAIVIMLKVNGARDTSFGSNGVQVWRSDNSAHAADFDTDGNLLLGGDSSSLVPVWRVSKLAPDGHTIWDAALNPRNFKGVLYDLTVTPDGGVLASGGIYGDYGVARIDAATGALDPTFGALGGLLRIPFGSIDALNHVTYTRLAVHADGRFDLLTTGYQDQDSNFVYSEQITRYMPDGSLDPIFTGPWNVDSGGELLVTDLKLDGDDPVAFNTAFVGIANDQMLQAARLHKFQGGLGARLTHNGSLQIGGTSRSDSIFLNYRVSDGHVLVHMGNLLQPNDTLMSFPPSKIKRISIYGFGGSDQLSNQTSVRGTYFDGGIGNDTVGGSPLADTILGGVGNDLLNGFDGNDVIYGNGGNDYLFGGNGNDSLFGQAGRDTLRGEDGNDQLFGGPASADIIIGGNGTDTAANDPLDIYKTVELLV